MFAWFFVSLDVLAANESYLIALLQVSGIGQWLCPLQVNIVDTQQRFRFQAPFFLNIQKRTSLFKAVFLGEILCWKMFGSSF